jgi:glycosyltransferase involved in cell wall biosynthesis
MNEPPFVSVIISAFNRKQFLSFAIDSLTRQTLDKPKFEIIVVKNFLDERIDLKLAELGAKMILMGEETMGDYLATAIENSSGSVLVFLDDDDEFVENRLEIIYDLFKKNPQIGYYHNDRIVIRAYGEQSKDAETFRSIETENMQKFGTFLVNASHLTKADANKLYLVYAFNYKSSLSIRRSNITPFLSYLRLINRAPDYFMFYAALASGCLFVLDARKLTKYRLHESNISSFRYKSRSSNLEREYIAHVEEGIKSLNIILQMLDRAKAKKLVRKMALHDLWTLRVDLDAIDPDCPRSKRILDLARYFSFGFRATFYYQIKVFLRTLVSIFFPKFARRWFIEQKIYQQ